MKFSRKDACGIPAHVSTCRRYARVTLRFGVVTTTVNENERALLWRGSLWKRRSEPGRNQEESGEKLLRKLMRSQVFSEVFRASLRFQPGKPRFQPRFRRGFSGVSPGFLRGFSGFAPGFPPGNPAFRGAFLTPRGGFPRAFKTAVNQPCFIKPFFWQQAEKDG